MLMKKRKLLERSGDLDAWIIDSLKDPKEAAAYLEVAIEEYAKDDDNKSFLMALENVAKAQGGIAMIAKKTKLSRESLYKTLSARGNPKLSTLGKLLKSMGFRLSIQRIKT